MIDVLYVLVHECVPFEGMLYSAGKGESFAVIEGRSAVVPWAYACSAQVFASNRQSSFERKLSLEPHINRLKRKTFK